jgi:hypothetical protein
MHDVSHCSVDVAVAVITEMCISAAYRISSSGSSLIRGVALIINKVDSLGSCPVSSKHTPVHHQNFAYGPLF